ncbi:MAG TPA: hypothetical protein P5518_07050 [Candidatus Cloacimonas sp.]|nr:hypothetical protein [Candidatus Cloacimonas sp.]
MKTIAISLLLLMPIMIIGQSISETLTQINSLKSELDNRINSLERSFENMRASDPLFADRDQFETEAEYANRILKGYAKMAELKTQNLKPIQNELTQLRSRIWETDNVAIELGKYDTNSETYSMTVQYTGYQQVTTNVEIKMPRDVAKTFFQNWNSMIKKGLLSVDPVDQISLANVFILDPITGNKFYLLDDIKTKAHEREFGNNIYIISDYQNRVILANQYYETLDKYQENIFIAFSTLSDSLEFAKCKIDTIYHPDQQIYDINSYKASPDLKYIAIQTTAEKGGNYLIDLDDDMIIPWISEITNFESISYSPDSKSIVYLDGPYIFVRDIATNSVVKTPMVDEKYGKILSLSPDFRKVGCVEYQPSNQRDRDPEIVLVDTDEQRTEIRLALPVRLSNFTLKFSPDSKLLATVSGNTVYLFSVETNTLVETFKVKGNIERITFSDDNDYLLVGASQKTGNYDLYSSPRGGGDYLETDYVNIFNLQTGKEVFSKLENSRPMLKNIFGYGLAIKDNVKDRARARSLAFTSNQKYIIKNNEILFWISADEQPISQDDLNIFTSTEKSTNSSLFQQPQINNQENVNAVSSSMIIAANEMLEADPQAYGQAAALFEQGGDYRQAALNYSKAKELRKAIINAEKIIPKPYDMLIDLYTEVGNKDKVSQYLDSLYIHNPDLSVAYYAKNRKTLELRAKAISDKQYSIAIMTYGNYQSINETEKDELMDLYQKAGDKAGLSELVNQRISDLLESKKSLTLTDYDTLIQYYSLLGNTAKVTEYQNKSNTRKADIAKAEKFWIGNTYNFSTSEIYGGSSSRYLIKDNHKATLEYSSYNNYNGEKGPTSYRTEELTWEIDELDTSIIKLSDGYKLVNKDGKVSRRYK